MLRVTLGRRRGWATRERVWTCRSFWRLSQTWVCRRAPSASSRASARTASQDSPVDIHTQLAYTVHEIFSKYLWKGCDIALSLYRHIAPPHFTKMPLLGDLYTHLTHRWTFLGLTRPVTQNGSSIASAVLAKYTIVNNAQRNPPQKGSYTNRPLQPYTVMRPNYISSHFHQLTAWE